MHSSTATMDATAQLSSILLRIPTVVGVWLGITVVLAFGIMIYNAFFHPLAKFPGPIYAGATRLWHTQQSLIGDLPFAIERLHKKYGDVVRVAPNELSYITADGFKDIYGHRSGKPEMPKDPGFYASINSGPHSVIRASRDRHGAIRRLLSHGFSDRALREQEHEILLYANKMIDRLHDLCKAGEPVNMVSWYNYFTFDLIGDLAFGESFGCLDSSSYHPWVSSIFSSVKFGSRLAAAHYYPFIQNLIRPLLPKKIGERRQQNRDLSAAKALRRMETQSDRVDFLGRMAETDSGATTEEFVDTAGTLIIAGSETTATLLSGLTYYLLMNPEKMEKLVNEIRTSFKTEEEINLVNINRLRYLIACLEEGLRMYPPIPGNLPRDVPPGGSVVNGRFVPENTIVSASHFATYHSESNFHLPNEFIPERFLGDERFKDDNREALQPFSVGPRNCLGKNLAYLEMKLALARLLWNFDLEILPESQGKWDKQCIYLLWEKNPLWVNLQPAPQNA